MSQKKLFYLLLAACNILFLAYYLMIGYYNQPALDDYCVIAAQNKWGFNSPITYWYHFWNGRFLPFYFCNIFLSIFEITNSLIFYTIFLIIGFIFAIYRILKILAVKHQNDSHSFILLNISAFIFNIFVYNNFKFNTFFWLNASTMYFGGIMFFLIGIGEVISITKKWFSIPLIIFSFVNAGCSLENHSLVMVLLMLGLIIFKFIFPHIYNYSLSKKYYWATASLLVSFFILIMAPGSQQRMASDASLVTQNNQLNLFLQFGENFICKYFMLWGEIILLYLPFALLLLPLFLTILNIQFEATETVDRVLKYTFWPIVVFTLGLMGASIAPTIYIFGNLGPQRILTITNALLLTFIILSSVYCFYYYFDKINFKLIHTLSTISFVLIIFQVSYRIYNEMPALVSYSQFEIHKRFDLDTKPPTAGVYLYPNPEEFNTPSFTEKFVIFLVKKISPDNIDNYSKLVKHEPVLPNIVDKFDVKIYDECFGEAFKKDIYIE